MTPRLFHFTCGDAATKIQANAGLLVPRFHPGLGRSLVWMTHDPSSPREALGLTSYSLGCDRMERRFIIDQPELAMHWGEVRDTLPRGFVRLMEAAPGTRPSSWWVSLAVQESRLDESYPQA